MLDRISLRARAVRRPLQRAWPTALHGGQDFAMKTDSFCEELSGLIGDEALLHLVESHGGCRLYVPTTHHLASELVGQIGDRAVRLLSERYGGDIIRVPLARELRTRTYLSQGLSLGQIARRLGITETGVDKLAKRIRAKVSH